MHLPHMHLHHIMHLHLILHRPHMHLPHMHLPHIMHHHVSCKIIYHCIMHHRASQHNNFYSLFYHYDSKLNNKIKTKHFKYNIDQIQLLLGAKMDDNLKQNHPMYHHLEHNHMTQSKM